MNYIDVILIAPVVFLCIKGLLSGFINQIAGLLGLVLGFYISLEFYSQAADFITEYYQSDYNHIIAFILLFVAVYITVTLIGKLITKATKALALSPLNRLLGLVLGAMKGAIVLVILLLILSYAKDLNNNKLSKEISKSIIYKTFIPYLDGFDSNSIRI